MLNDLLEPLRTRREQTVARMNGLEELFYSEKFGSFTSTQRKVALMEIEECEEQIKSIQEDINATILHVAHNRSMYY